jgi:pilus assembly protein Flp/PilA
MKNLPAKIVGTVVATKERGATAVEYGIMVALIAAVIITVVSLLGTQLSGMFKTVSDSLLSSREPSEALPRSLAGCLTQRLTILRAVPSDSRRAEHFSIKSAMLSPIWATSSPTQRIAIFVTRTDDK